MITQALKDLIAEAFQGVQLGSGVGLWQGEAIDDYKSEAAQAIERLKDEKLDWSKIPDEHLYGCELSLCYFDPEGMRFHLPAFLLAEIDGKTNTGPLFHLTSLAPDAAVSPLNQALESSHAALSHRPPHRYRTDA